MAPMRVANVGAQLCLPTLGVAVRRARLSELHAAAPGPLTRPVAGGARYT